MKTLGTNVRFHLRYMYLLPIIYSILSYTTLTALSYLKTGFFFENLNPLKNKSFLPEKNCTLRKSFKLSFNYLVEFRCCDLNKTAH
jgi:hypothetical protein